MYKFLKLPHPQNLKSVIIFKPKGATVENS